MDAELRAGNKGQSDEELEATLDKSLMLFRYIQVGRIEILRESCILVFPGPAEDWHSDQAGQRLACNNSGHFMQDQAMLHSHPACPAYILPILPVPRLSCL